MLRAAEPRWLKSQLSNGFRVLVRIFKRDNLWPLLDRKTEVFPWKRPEKRMKPRCRRSAVLLWEDRGLKGDKKYAENMKKELFDLRIVSVEGYEVLSAKCKIRRVEDVI